MVPEGFAEFFLASAGTGGAFVGLLFVAISIGPQRTFGDSGRHGCAAAAPRRSHLLDTAQWLRRLQPRLDSRGQTSVGSPSCWGSRHRSPPLHLSWLFARFHRHGSARYPPWRDLLRVVSLSLIATVVFAIESLVGLRLILRPTDVDAYRWLGAIIIGLYALGMLRAWTLLGRSPAWLERLAQPIAGPGGNRRYGRVAGNARHRVARHVERQQTVTRRHGL